MKKDTVLIVEDDIWLSQLLKDILEPHFNIVLTTKGEDVKKIMDNNNPQLLLVDIKLSGYIDGLSLIRIIKSDPKYYDRPIIVMSANEDEEIILQSIEIGAVDYAHKPLNVTLLKQKIISLVELRKSIIGNKEKQTLTALNLGELTGTSRIVQRFDTIVDEMIQNDKKLQMKDIAKRLEVSVSTLERLIKKYAKSTPNRLIRNRKLEKAKIILASDEIPVKQVAFTLGFSSVSYFTKCFKDHFGFSPTKLKKNNNYHIESVIKL